MMLDGLKAIYADVSSIDFHSLRSRSALRTSLAVVSCLLIGYVFNFDNAHWGAWCAFMVSQASNGATVRRALQFVLGTICTVVIIIALIDWFDNQPVMMFFIAIGLTTIYLYYVAKTGNTFWLISVIILLIIVFEAASGPAPVELMAYSTDLVIQISMGSFFAVVMIVLMPDYAVESVHRSNRKMLVCLGDLVTFAGRGYRGESLHSEFVSQSHAVRSLVSQQQELRAQCAYERNAYMRILAFNEQLERVLLSVLDLVSYVDSHYDKRLDLFSSHIDMENLFKQERQLLAYLLEYVDDFDSVSVQDMSSHLKSLQDTMDGIVLQLSLMRDTGVFTKCESKMQSTLEKYVLTHQKIILLMRGLYFQSISLDEAKKPNPKAFVRKQVDLLGCEPYRWSFAFKGALVFIGVTTIGLHFNLNASIAFIVAFLSLNSIVDNRAAFGFFVGYPIGLLCAFITIFMGLDSFGFSLVLALGVSYLLAYILSRRDSLTLAFSLSAFMAYFYTVYAATGPIGLNDYNTSLVGLWSGYFCMTVLCLISMVFPTNKKQLLMASNQKINDDITKIRGLLPNFRHLSMEKTNERLHLASRIRHSLNAMRYELDRVSIDYFVTKAQKRKLLEAYVESAWNHYFAWSNTFLSYRAMGLAPTLFDDIAVSQALELFNSDLDDESKLSHLDILLASERSRLDALGDSGAPVAYRSFLYGFDVLMNLKAVIVTKVVWQKCYDETLGVLKS